MVCRASVPFPFGDWEKHLPPINGAQAPPTPSLSFILKAEGVGLPYGGQASESLKGKPGVTLRTLGRKLPLSLKGKGAGLLSLKGGV